jgi:hypothetical protein
MERQGEIVPATTHKAIAGLTALVSAGFGVILAYSLEDASEPDSLVLLLLGRDVAHMVLNLTRSSCRNSGLPAWSIHNAILEARARGCDVFDFNGANSPNRGDDKHSYGAAARLYFRVDFES